MTILFPCGGMGTRIKSLEAMFKPEKVMMNVRNFKEVTIKVKSGMLSSTVFHQWYHVFYE